MIEMEITQEVKEFKKISSLIDKVKPNHKNQLKIIMMIILIKMMINIKMNKMEFS